MTMSILSQQRRDSCLVLVIHPVIALVIPFRLSCCEETLCIYTSQVVVSRCLLALRGARKHAGRDHIGTSSASNSPLSTTRHVQYRRCICYSDFSTLSYAICKSWPQQEFLAREKTETRTIFDLRCFQLCLEPLYVQK